MDISIFQKIESLRRAALTKNYFYGSDMAVLTLTPRVKVVGPGEIPKEGIKAKRVIDRRKKI